MIRRWWSRHRHSNAEHAVCRLRAVDRYAKYGLSLPRELAWDGCPLMGL